jgi:hypothetical protein
MNVSYVGGVALKSTGTLGGFKFGGKVGVVESALFTEQIFKVFDADHGGQFIAGHRL